MPRIREYSGYGNQSADQESDARRERVYRLPEVLTEPKDETETEEVEVEPKEDVVIDTAFTQPEQEIKNENKENQPMEEKKRSIEQPLTFEKIVIHQADLTPKYTTSEAAINSIAVDGAFYEDYSRSSKTELLKDKEFVLSVISQCHERYFAPETPKSADWIDELYLAERSSVLFEQVREGACEDATKEFGIELYVFLRKFSFAEDAFKLVDREVRRTMKIASAQVRSSEDAERMRASLNHFQSAVATALAQVKQKHHDTEKAKTDRKQKLQDDKKQLVTLIDNMKF